MLTEAQLIVARPLVRAVVRKFLGCGAGDERVDDLTQSTMLDMWRDRDEFTGTQEAEALAWANLVAIRRCGKFVRSLGREKSALGQLTAAGGYYPRAVSTPEDTLGAVEAVTLYEKNLARLAHRARQKQAEYLARTATALALAA